MIARVILLHLALLSTVTAADLLVISDREFHLGTEGLPDWAHFAGRTPHGRELELRFHARANAHEATLFLRHKDARSAPWELRLNGQRIGELFCMEAHVAEAFAVPEGALRDGENVLSLHAPKAVDDILVSDIKLDPRPIEEVLTQAFLEIRVTEAGAGALPCRITIVDAQGALAPFHVAPGQGLVSRPGVIYTRDGTARVGVRPGPYTVYAGRGFEYSVSTQRIDIARGDVSAFDLQLRREIPTPGLVACDTHIHNLTFSKHGEAGIDETMLVIAGEGIELAVATDHNHHTDYTEFAARMRVKDHFTSVIGNEVTTRAGHFNAYPVRPGAALPDHTITNWPALMQNIRSTTGARVIQLNHPRDTHYGFAPFGEANFNAVTGENLREPGFTFDAVEVVTSTALQSDIMRLYHDWFALLNHGHRITALGSSDTHHVSRKILGQARSYVMCDDSDPAKIDVDAVCQSFLAGRVCVSMGLLTRMTVEDVFAVGDLATNLGRTVRVKVSVVGPSWVEADTVQLFANGLKIREEKIRGAPGGVVKGEFTWNIPRPLHDVHLVAIATGPGVSAPFWALPRPYQPTSKELNPRVIGSTNPIWLDADGDGRFTAARGYAAQLIARHGTDPARLLPALAEYDESIAIQAAGLCHAAGHHPHGERFANHLAASAGHVRDGFARHAETLRGK